MDLFDLLIIGFVIYAVLRGMARVGRQAGAPREPAEPPLEGLGFPRPSGPSRIPQAPPGQQDVHAEEAAGLVTAEAREPVESRRREVTTPGPIAESEPDRRAEGTSRAGSLLPQLDRYSELERAILYAEILAPPKALRE